MTCKYYAFLFSQYLQLYTNTYQFSYIFVNKNYERKENNFKCFIATLSICTYRPFYSHIMCKAISLYRVIDRDKIFLKKLEIS